MAALFATKKAFTAPPTVRTLASGVPSAPLINLAARDPHAGHHHVHGAAEPRSDAPAKFSGGLYSTSNGLVSKRYATGMSFRALGKVIM